MSKIKLSFQEHYFTASKHKGGFHTLDFTEGLRKEEINELEKKGSYNPPVKLPTNPTETEMEGLFPTNISFFKLKSSGKYVFLHSKYIGKANDSVRRHGNYFTHSLILSESSPSYPVKFVFEKAVFKNSFSVEEDEAYTPKLKVEQQFEIENSDYTLENSFRDFQTFLQGEPNRIHVFSRVFDLILEGKIAKAGYNITICDRKENLTNMILAVHYFLPISLANKVSFATYVDNPESTNYPFEITGVIPECGIDKLPEPYFKFVDATKGLSYEAVQDYSKLLVRIISSGNYSNWKDLLKETEEQEITELNHKLNAPANFIDFKINIRNDKTVEDFKKLLSQISETKKVELKGVVFKENKQLYQDYILDELNKIFNDKFSNLQRQCEEFLSLYKEFFNNEPAAKQDLFLQFIEAFRDKFSGKEKSKTSMFILSNLNCNELNLLKLEEIFESADLYLDEDFDLDEKINIVNDLSNIYDMKKIKKENLKNITKIQSLNEIRNAAENGNLINSLTRYKETLKLLNESDRQKIIIMAFNNEFTKNQFDGSFGKYIQIIKEYFSTSEPYFWKEFFDNNKRYNPDNNIKFHSLDYLKKKFIAHIFHKEIYRFELYEKLLPLSTYELKWISEDISENAKKTSIIEKFFEQFKDHQEIRTPAIFSIIKMLNPFKK